MKISAFARDEWANGERDHTAAAERFLEFVLASDDPRSSLLTLVTEAMGDQFRRFRLSLERKVGSWDQPERTPGAHSAHESPDWDGTLGATAVSEGQSEGGAQCRNAGQTGRGTTLTPLDLRQRLLAANVWIYGKGLIPWEDVLLEDIEPTVRHYNAEVRGVKVKIELLKSARRLMQQHNVERLGDVPLADVAKILPSPDKAA